MLPAEFRTRRPKKERRKKKKRKKKSRAITLRIRMLFHSFRRILCRELLESLIHYTSYCDVRDSSAVLDHYFKTGNFFRVAE